jgi:colanic acid biosynthesis glycosyl transferase WcaI
MNILLIHQHYFPEMSGTARRTRELSESFVNMNHRVSVITSFPREFRSIPGVKCRPFEIMNGVRVHRIKTLFEVKNNVFLRLLAYIAFVLQSIVLAIRLSKKSDIVISVAPISSGIIGSFVKIINKKHHHFDVPDILPDLGISAGMIKNRLIISFLFKLERWVYDHADTVSAITLGQIDNIHGKGVAKSKLFYIPDWIDDTFFKKNLKKYKDEVTRMLKSTDKKLISFVGNIGALQNPVIFIEMMASLEADNMDEFQFLFIGDGIMLPKLKENIKSIGLKNVEFVGRVKREYIPAYMHLSDILVANYLPNNYMDICIPGKLFEYAISNKPIIMGARGEAKKLIEKYLLGIAVQPSDVAAFKKAILQISNGSYSYKPKTEIFVEDFSLEKVSNLYNQIFDRVI